MDELPKYPDVGRRAVALRTYAGYPGHGGQKKFAQDLGIGPGLWSMIERGGARFSYRVVKIIKKKFPAVDTEWLQDGIEDNMPPKLMRELRHILDGLAKATTTPA